MAKTHNQKLKLIYLMKILLEKTDENHTLTVPQMITELAALDISAERKSIYDDLEMLRAYGLDIERIKGKTTGYFVANRTFELPELKLLVDSVQASKFITLKKSRELISKLSTFTSIHEAGLIKRQLYVANRIKTMNESIYYNVDKIHSGISSGKKISFKYFKFGLDKKPMLRHDGERYSVSPFALTWDDENYYMLGYDDKAGIMKHYRVDKMLDICVTDTPRDGNKEFSDFDTAVYSKKVFGMFGGKEEKIKLKFENRFIGVAIDRFGKDISPQKTDDEHFSINVNVIISPQFFGWLFGLNGGAMILSPEYVVDEMKNHVQSVAKIYN